MQDRGQWYPVDATISQSDWYDRDLSLPTVPVPPPSRGSWSTNPAFAMVPIAQARAARIALGEHLASLPMVYDQSVAELHRLSERYRNQAKPAPGSSPSR